jgi:RND family efflux transporter MFP subunit
MSTRSANALLLSLLVAACSRNESTPARETVQAPVVAARRASLPAFHSVAGTVRSQTASTLAANVVGTVVRVAVAEGDRVRTGDILVEIDAREPRAQEERARAGRDELDRAIEGASANAQLAETTYRRFEALHERGSASTQEYDEARTRQAAARAELARLTASRQGARAAVTQAAAVLGYSSVRAPIDGVVTARFVDPGAQAAPGVPLVSVEEERATRVDATVPESVSVVPDGRAFVEAGEQRVEARVVHVQPSVDSTARTALVKLELARPLRAGTYVKVSFPAGERSAIVIPASSLVRHGQLASVFVAGIDGVARMRLVTAGATSGADVEILSGLDAGEAVVSIPSRVRDGVIVRSGP